MEDVELFWNFEAEIRLQVRRMNEYSDRSHSGWSHSGVALLHRLSRCRALVFVTRCEGAAIVPRKTNSRLISVATLELSHS